MNGGERSPEREFDIEALRVPPDFTLPETVMVSRTVDYPPARQALLDIGERYLASLREHPFNLGWDSRLLYQCS